MEVLEAELWQLVDQRLDQVRRLPYDELLRRTAGEPEIELLERPSGMFRRRTRLVACPNDRFGITVRVEAEDGAGPPREASSSRRVVHRRPSGRAAASHRVATHSRSALVPPSPG